jgi:hypothetical protein
MTSHLQLMQGCQLTSVQTNTVTTGRAVNLNLASIRLESLRRIFRRDTALDGKSSRGNAVLSQTQLLQRSTSRDLNLCSHNINTGNLLSDGVLDLNTRVDLNKVVTTLLIDQELGSTSVAIVGGLCKSDGVVEDGISRLRRKILGRRQLNNLLMTTLHGAVTLVQVNDIAVVVSQQLHLNMLGTVEEALDEDGSVAESGLGLGCGSLEGVLEILLLPHHTHATSSTAEGGLDDDWEAVFVGEFLACFELGHWAGRTGDCWHVGLCGQLSCGHLVAEVVDGLRVGSDPDDASSFDSFGEFVIFTEETISGVDEVDAWEMSLDGLLSRCHSQDS